MTKTETALPAASTGASNAHDDTDRAATGADSRTNSNTGAHTDSHTSTLADSRNHQPTPRQGRGAASTVALVLVGAIAVGAVASSALLWQRLERMQTQLARQSADSGALAVEARGAARKAEDIARETASRLTVMETRVGEVALQRTQLEELMQSLSRTRDEDLVADLEASLRLAQQQAQLTGSLQPLEAGLKNAQQRIERAAQPRLAPVQRALEQDLLQLAQASVTDTVGLLGRVDSIARQIDALPLLNTPSHPGKPALVDTLPTLDSAQAAANGKGNDTSSDGGATNTDNTTNAPAEAQTEPPLWQQWLQRIWQGVRQEAVTLLRVRRLDQPDAMLLAPEQAYFVRENLKLQLLNARLGILARRMDAARADLASTQQVVQKYCDPDSRRTQSVLTGLQQLQEFVYQADTPTLDESFAALATAAAGR